MDFTSEQRKTVDKVGMAFKMVGIFLMIWAIAVAVTAIDGIAAKQWVAAGRAIVQFILFMGTSRFLRRAGNALDAAGKAASNGVALLMDGLEEVRGAMRFFGLTAIVMFALEIVFWLLNRR